MPFTYMIDWLAPTRLALYSMDNGYLFIVMVVFVKDPRVSSVGPSSLNIIDALLFDLENSFVQVDRVWCRWGSVCIVIGIFSPSLQSSSIWSLNEHSFILLMHWYISIVSVAVDVFAFVYAALWSWSPDVNQSPTSSDSAGGPTSTVSNSAIFIKNELLIDFLCSCMSRSPRGMTACLQLGGISWHGFFQS